MKNLFTIIGILFLTISKGQIDYVKLQKNSLAAKRAYDKEDYADALMHFEEAFIIKGATTPIDYLKAANAASHLSQHQKCREWIIASIVKEKLEKETILGFSKEKSYQESAESIVEEYNTYLERFYEDLPNKAVYFKMQKLLNRDQFSRKLSNYHLGVTEEEIQFAFSQVMKLQDPKDSLERKKYQSILFPKVNDEHQKYEDIIRMYTDSLNVREFMGIIEEHGFQDEGWLLLWHQRDSYDQNNWVWSYFKPLIDEEILKGNISPSYWAMFEDVTSLHKTGKSIYGYHPGKVDPSQVNKKRKEIGLPALTDAEIESRNNNPYGGGVF